MEKTQTSKSMVCSLDARLVSLLFHLGLPRRLLLMFDSRNKLPRIICTRGVPADSCSKYPPKENTQCVEAREASMAVVMDAT